MLINEFNDLSFSSFCFEIIIYIIILYGDYTQQTFNEPLMIFSWRQAQS